MLFTCILRTFAIDFQIEFTELYPLSFLEFLDAMEQDKLAKLLQSKDWELITMFQSKLQEYPLYAVPILKNLAASASIPSSQEAPYLYDCRKAHG